MAALPPSGDLVGGELGTCFFAASEFYSGVHLVGGGLVWWHEAQL